MVGVDIAVMTRQPAAPDQAFIDGERVGRSEVIWMPLLDLSTGQDEDTETFLAGRARGTVTDIILQS